MKNLRILIITDDEESSTVAPKLVAEIISSQGLSANFYYLKGFNSAVADKKKIVAKNRYDLICLVSNWPTVNISRTSKILDFVEYVVLQADKFSLVSSFNLLIGETEKQDFAFYFLLSDVSVIKKDAKEGLKKCLDGKKTVSYKTSKLIDNAVCIFSYEYHYEKNNDEARKKCRLIENALDGQKVEYFVFNPGSYATQVQFPNASIMIRVADKDLSIVKELVKESKLTFWQTWMQEATVLASYPDPGCIE